MTHGMRACARAWRGSRVTGCAASAALALAACGPRVAQGTGAGETSDTARTVGAGAVQADTIRGTLTRTGSEPATVLLLTARDGARFALQGATGDLLRRVVGLEIMVEGARTARAAAGAAPTPVASFRADRFVVRAADGQAAHDGVIARDAAGTVLVLADRRRVAAPNLPAAIRDRLGARVFVAGPLDAAPVSYGIIHDAPASSREDAPRTNPHAAQTDTAGTDVPAVSPQPPI